MLLTTQYAPDPEDDDDALLMLARGGGPRPQPAALPPLTAAEMPVLEHEAPAAAPTRAAPVAAAQPARVQRQPMTQPTAPDDGAGQTITSALALLADLAINRGRNVGPMIASMNAPKPGAMTPYQAAQLEMERRRVASSEALNAARAESLRTGRSVDPELLDIRRRTNDIAQTRESRLGSEAAARAAAAREESSGESELSKSAVARVYAMHPDLTGKLDGASYSELIKSPALRSELEEMRARQAHINRLSEEGARQENRVALVDARDQDRTEAEARAAERKTADAAARQDAEGSGVALDVADFEDLHGRLTIMSPQKYARDNENRFIVRKRKDDVQTVDRALAASERLHELAAAMSQINPATDPEKWREMEQEYQLFKDEHQGIILRIAGMSGGGSTGERADIKDMLPERLNPAAVARLRGTENFLRQQAHETLRNYGIGVRGYENEARGEPAWKSTLPTTKQKRKDVPKVPIKPAQPAAAKDDDEWEDI